MSGIKTSYFTLCFCLLYLCFDIISMRHFRHSTGICKPSFETYNFYIAILKNHYPNIIILVVLGQCNVQVGKIGYQV